MSTSDSGSSSERDPDREGREGQEARAEDDVWRDIIAHYGDRAELPDLPAEPSPPGRTYSYAVAEDAAEDRDDERDPGRGEERYVPPTVPPAPLPRGPRALAWAGLFGSPVVMLVFLAAGLTIPGWLAIVLFVAFVGGFGYLVATMRKHDDSDPWDDGAVV